MKILIINHKEKECGVYQYGARVGSILSKSTKHNFEYFECSSSEEFNLKTSDFKPNVIIYNYLPETMPWFSGEILSKLRMEGVKQGLIVHNIGYSVGFDFYLHQNPRYPENGINFPILRPLFEFLETEKKPNETLQIGSFGFGFKFKKYEDICELVNDQFSQATINLHLTVSKFFPNYEELEEIKKTCQSVITKPDIKINFTSNHLEDKDLLIFLSKNDLNIFLYKNYDNYNGISSVVDYGLSVDTPLAVCKSNMFNHINDVSPSICIEDTPLKKIISNGPQVLNKHRNEWNHENFISSIEKVLDKI